MSVQSNCICYKFCFWLNIKDVPPHVLERSLEGYPLYEKSDYYGNHFSLQEALKDSGIFILFNGQNNEEELLGAFTPMLNKLKISQAYSNRVAIILTQCDNAILYTQLCKLGATKLFKKIFPNIYSIINDSLESMYEIEYFAMSCFGMISTNPPEPNVIRELVTDNLYSQVLKDPKIWKPFGLISPLYWLSTGKRHPQLDKDYL
jgi:hypothetical protein